MSKFSDKEIRDCFDAMDLDKSGFVSRSEIAKGLEQLPGITKQDVEELTQVRLESEKCKQGWGLQ